MGVGFIYPGKEVKVEWSPIQWVPIQTFWLGVRKKFRFYPIVILPGLNVLCLVENCNGHQYKAMLGR